MDPGRPTFAVLSVAASVRGFVPIDYRSQSVRDPTRTDAYGQLVIIGYRRAITEAEAAIICRIPEMYARRMSAQRVPPPRPKKVRKAQGWTWTTISGSRKKGIGILNNEV